jgi:hypothetical protein
VSPFALLHSDERRSGEPAPAGCAISARFFLNLHGHRDSRARAKTQFDRRLDRTVDSLAHRVDEDTAIPDY